MSNLQSTTTIRQRGQLTIPDPIRKDVDWTTVGSIVTVAVEKPDKIIISPYSPVKKLNWNKLWRDIERVRSYKGKGGGNLSRFIAEDRESRR